MLKSTIITFILLLFINQSLISSALEPYSDYSKSKKLADNAIITKHSIIEKHTFRSDFGTHEDVKKSLVSKEYFDENGNLIKFESYGDYNEVIVNSIFSYNAENMLMQIEEKDSFRTIIMKQEFKYDPFGKLIKIISSGFRGDTLQVTTFEYVEQKQVAIETVKDSSHNILDYYVHLYDKAFNRIVKSTHFDVKNEIKGITAFFYNDFGINSREVYSKNIDEPYKIKYQNFYDDRGRLAEIRNLKYPDDLIITVFNDFNDFDLISKTTMIQPSGETVATISFDYITH